MASHPAEIFIPDQPEGVPFWSGGFTRLPSGLGVMLVHADDLRRHPFPFGWKPLNDEPLYVDDMEVWLLERA